MGTANRGEIGTSFAAFIWAANRSGTLPPAELLHIVHEFWVQCEHWAILGPNVTVGKHRQQVSGVDCQGVGNVTFAIGAVQASTGHHVWDLRVDCLPSHYLMLGVVPAGPVNVSPRSIVANTWLLQSWKDQAQGFIWHRGGTFSRCSNGCQPGHVVRVSLDITRQIVEFTVNGVAQGPLSLTAAGGGDDTDPFSLAFEGFGQASVTILGYERRE